MASLEIEGILIQKLPVQSGESARGHWEKQEFVVEFQEGSFPTKVAFSVWGAEKVSELARYTEGSKLKVFFNIASREFNGKWYTDLRAWRITNANEAQAVNNQAYVADTPAGFSPSQSVPTSSNSEPVIEGEGDYDDLPF